MNAPLDMARYYPKDYYSFSDSSEKENFARTFARRLRAAAARRGWSSLPYLSAPEWESWFPERLSRHAAIIDMGCGNGARLKRLRQEGFTRLVGYDSLLPTEVQEPQGINLSRIVKDEWLGAFDVVMYHHSLEHMPDQAGALELAAAVLKPKGEVVVRIPLSDSIAYKRYGTRWVQLDAPRHLFLHSRTSIFELAAQVGLRVSNMTYDSTGFQFWGSELYLRGEALHQTDIGQFFSPQELGDFEREARYLNQAGCGDQAAIRLVRASA